MDLEHYLAVMKGLSDGGRVRMLLALRDGELCVCQLIELLQLAASTVSRHIAVLKQAGLVKSRKDGRWIYYRLANDDKQLVQLCQYTFEILAEADDIKADEEKLRTIKKCGLEALCKTIKK